MCVGGGVINLMLAGVCFCMGVMCNFCVNIVVHIKKFVSYDHGMPPKKIVSYVYMKLVRFDSKRLNLIVSHAAVQIL